MNLDLLVAENGEALFHQDEPGPDLLVSAKAGPSIQGDSTARLEAHKDGQVAPVVAGVSPVVAGRWPR